MHQPITASRHEHAPFRGGALTAAPARVPALDRRPSASRRASASALRARLGAKRFNPLAAAPKAVASKKAFSVQANSDKVQDGPPLYAEGELDIYRESPLRYMGYSNEVGEAFAAFLPGWGVPASYGVAGE